MKNIAFLFASLSSLFAIILEAFHTHYYKNKNNNKIKNFEIAIKYQMYHNLLIIILAFFFEIEHNIEQIILLLFILGIILFSGSIYFFYFKSNIKNKIKYIKYITPLGGITLILSWFLLFLYGIYFF